MDITLPIQLTPSYVPYIWGGTLLHHTLGKPDMDRLGESWEVSVREDKPSLVPDGGTLKELAAQPGFMGGAGGDIQLLIKFIGASQRLSVQVHPSDADVIGEEQGKAEAWYVVHAEEGAELVWGINCSREDFARNVAQGNVAGCLNRVQVHSGDVFNIRPGQVHAIGEGIVIYEVQQNSETTFRIYDWDRVDQKTGQPRQLHVERAKAVIKAEAENRKVPGVVVKEKDAIRYLYLNTEHFVLERIQVLGSFTDAFLDAPAYYSVISGQGEASGRGGCIPLNTGDSFVLPAAAGELRFRGNAVLLKSHRPAQSAYQDYLASLGAETLTTGEIRRISGDFPQK